MKNKITYMVTYEDDQRKRHITFVTGYSQVRFIEERFGKVSIEATERFISTTKK